MLTQFFDGGASGIICSAFRVDDIMSGHAIPAISPRIWQWLGACTGLGAGLEPSFGIFGGAGTGFGAQLVAGPRPRSR